MQRSLPNLQLRKLKKAPFWEYQQAGSLLQEEPYRGLPTGMLPEERVDIQEVISQYKTYSDWEVSDIKERVDSLEDQIVNQAQLIRDLRRRQIVPIQNLHSSKLLLLHPLYITLEYGNNIFVASSEDLNLYGDGDTELGAIRNLCREIEALFFDLKKNQNRLGKFMKENWGFLKTIAREL